ncbi:MAG: hypothetical protein MSH08_02575 [Ezakiella sp.]|nr:hypothetical protein [Ezakiella sp.]
MKKKLSIMIVLSIILMSVVLPVFAKSPDDEIMGPGSSSGKIYKKYVVPYPKIAYIPTNFYYVDGEYSGTLYLKTVTYDSGYANAIYEGWIYQDQANPNDKRGSQVFMEKVGDGYRVVDKRENALNSNTVLLDLTK